MKKRGITRTTYSALNAIIGMSSQVITTLVGLISRKVFVMMLGYEMQGVNTTFTSIISMISLAELGIGTAIICNLYKPLAEQDEEKIISLMQLYSKVYRAIAGIVFVIGICVCPFLNMLIEEDVDTLYLTVLYLLFLMDAVISYLFAYKRSIITADQRNFIITLVHTFAQIAMNALQILVLLKTKSFILFLVLKVLFRFIENAIISYIANKQYPFIKTKEKHPVDKATKDNIIGNTKALALHYVGNYLINGTDALIITKFLGAAVTGVYSNYLLITTTLREVLGQFSSNITASFGNIIACGEKDNLFNAFKKSMFVAFVFSNFAAVSLFCLFNPFISIWMGAKLGEESLLSMPVVGIISFNFYIVVLSEPLGSLRASAGLFRPDRYLHLVLAALNLVISICFVKIKFIGLFGVFLGTLICLFIKEMTVLPRIVCHQLLNISTWKYLKRLYLYILITVVNSAVTYGVCSLVSFENAILTLVVKAVICVIIPNVIVILLFHKTDEFVYLRGLLLRVLNKVIGKLRRSAVQ